MYTFVIGGFQLHVILTNARSYSFFDGQSAIRFPFLNTPLFFLMMSFFWGPRSPLSTPPKMGLSAKIDTIPFPPSALGSHKKDLV